MASNGYYHTYFNQQAASQPARSHNDYSVASPQGYANDASSIRNTHEREPQTHEQAPNYQNAQGWYGLNSSDLSLGRAAETLSSLGNATRQPAVSSPATGIHYPAQSHVPVHPSSNSPQSGHVMHHRHGASYPYPSQQMGREGSRPPLQQYPPRPESVSSARSAVSGPGPSPRIHGRPMTNAQHPPQPQHGRQASGGPQNVQRTASPAQMHISRGGAQLQFQTTQGHSRSNSGLHNPPYGAHQVPPAQSTGHTLPLPSPSTLSQAPAMTSAQEFPGQTTLTVDPAQVYDPWPEYQRRKAAEDMQREKLRAEEAERQLMAEEAERRRLNEVNERQVAQDAATGGQNRPDEQAAGAANPSRPKKTQKGQSKKDLSRGPKAKAAAAKANQPASAQSNVAASPSQPSNDDDEDAQMLAMLKAMKAKDPERFKRLMNAEDSADPAPASTPAKKATARSKKPTKTSNKESKDPGPQVSVVDSRDSSVPSKVNDPTGRSNPAAAKESQHVLSPQSKATLSAITPTQHSTQVPMPVTVTAKVADAKTVWPEHKKTQLAQAAAAHLNAYPENRIRQIDPERIVSLLNGNPSYVTLCEQVEATGLHVDRRAFARCLLQAVPDVNTAAQRQRKGPDQPRQSSEKLPEQNPQDGASVLPVLTAPGVERLPNDPVCDAVPNTSASLVVPTKPEPRSATPSTVAAASKEEAARKRTFGDLVDLTAISDDEPDPKHLAIDPQLLEYPVFSQPWQVSQPVDYSHFTPHLQHPTLHQMPPPYPPVPFHPVPAQPATATLHQMPPPYPPVPFHPVPAQPAIATPPTLDTTYRNMPVVRPISRSKARRRAGYDPKTIARDVLLATGRHPDMYHLNAHLEGLKSRFSTVTEKADLATLRWDLIDPGDPLPLPTLEDDGDSSVADAEAEEIDEEKSSERQRETTPPFPVKTHDRIRHDGAKNEVQVKQYVHSKNRPANRSGLKPTRGRGRGRGRGSRTSHHGSTSRHSNSDTAGLHEQFGYKPRHEETDKLRSETRPMHRNATSGSPSVTTSKHNSPMSGTGYSAFRQLNPDGTKKRGRPVGWRKAVHMNPAGSGSADGAKASGRHLEPVAEPERNYEVFGCKWSGCTAELHNLKTLRAHVNKAHSKSTTFGYACRWEGCSKKSPTGAQKSAAEETQLDRHVFRDQMDWWGHLEKEHLAPIAWQMGDGPPSGLSDAFDSEQSEAYLSDSHGRLVTPRIKTPPRTLETSERLELPSNSTLTGVKRGRPELAKATLEQKALEAEEAHRNKKLQIGVGLDKGGATLANDKRRQGFIDDEDFEVVVDE